MESSSTIQRGDSIMEEETAAQTARTALNRYGDMIVRFAYTYVHNLEDAQDILQETLIQLLQKCPVFDSAEHEKAWLFKVAANLSKNRIKYNKRRRTDELHDDLVSDEREDLAFVWDAVKQLPDKYRAAIHLFYYEGFSTAEIAQILGRKETTIRTDLHRGRIRLRKILKEYIEP